MKVIHKNISYLITLPILIMISLYIFWLGTFPDSIRLSILGIWSGLYITICAVQSFKQDKRILNLESQHFLIMFLPLISFISSILYSHNRYLALFHPYNGPYILFLLYLFLIGSQKTKSTYLLSLIEAISIILALEHILRISLIGLSSTLFVNSFIGTTFLLGFILICKILLYLQNKESHNTITIKSKVKSLITAATFLASLIILFSLDTSTHVLSIYNSVQVTISQCYELKRCLFGVGVDNFSSLFTLTKKLSWIHSPLWQVQSYRFSGSLILQLIGELGVIVLIPIVFIFWQIILKSSRNLYPKVGVYILSFIVFVTLIFSPPSFESLLVFFIYINLLFSQNDSTHKILLKKVLIDTPIRKLILSVLLLFSALITFYGTYWTIRLTLSDYYSQKAHGLILKGVLRSAYDLQKKSISLFPYISDYHREFAATNFLIAINQDRNINSPDSTPQQIHLIKTQALQTAIREYLAATSLSPHDARSYEYLGDYYEILIGKVNNAPEWSLASYQKAISLDPLNPYYHYRVAQIYYKISNFSKAKYEFSLATKLRSDFAEAYQAMALSMDQLGQKNEAKETMVKAITLFKNNNRTREYQQAILDLNRL